MNTFKPSGGWGPMNNRAALSITFDNLGEAGMLDRGEWHGPVGQHFTAAFVPKLIAKLGEVPATYFIEASNVALYPEAITAWHRAGHEVGLHAWRHEAWGRTQPEIRRGLLVKSIAAMRSIGIEPVGFRPPGGELDDAAWEEFEQAGLLYCSPAGEPGIRRVGDMLALPFTWPHVDAFVIEHLAAPLRLAFGGQAEPRGLEHWSAELDKMLEDILAEGTQRTVIFHPEFIGASDHKLDVLMHLIARARKADIWIARARDVAAFAAEALGLGARARAAA